MRYARSSTQYLEMFACAHTTSPNELAADQDALSFIARLATNIETQRRDTRRAGTWGHVDPTFMCGALWLCARLTLGVSLDSVRSLSKRRTTTLCPSR